MIQIFNLTKEYMRGVPAIKGIDLHIRKGQFCFITGASGAGKTTLLKLIFSAERPSAGQVLVAGRNISRLSSSSLPYFRRQMGVVFQDYKLLNSRTVFDNVAFALEVLGRPRREIKRRVYLALRQVGLAHKLEAYPLRLSGGEQQRVAIARAIVNQPMILLADEPTGNLDREMTWEIMNLFNEINIQGTTLLIATHDREVVERYAKREIQLRNGRLISSGEPLELE